MAAPVRLLSAAMQARPKPEIETPFVADGLHVRPEWIDSNGHLNIAYYLKLFDQGFDASYERIGFRADVTRDVNASGFAAELHLTFQRELMVGDRVRVATQLLDFDAKRIRMFQLLYHAESGELSATCEWMSLYIDMTKRRVAEMPELLQQRLARVKAAHARLPMPPEAGRGITLQNRRRAGG
jgi:acyl-CoA thioester hydrolase